MTVVWEVADGGVEAKNQEREKKKMWVGSTRWEALAFVALIPYEGYCLIDSIHMFDLHTNGVYIHNAQCNPKNKETK